MIEFLKNWAGFRFGYRFLPALPANVIELMVLGITMGILLIETHYNHQIAVSSLPKNSFYQLRTRSTFCLFTASFLLSILWGNRFQHFATPQTGDFIVWASVSRVERPVHEVESQAPIDDIQKTRPLTRKELRKERRLARQKHPQRPMEEPGTGVYILLFVLGIALAYLGAGLSCSLSCSNQGLAAVVVGLLALGALVGGFYFLIRALTRKSRQPKVPGSTVPRN